MRSGEIFCHQMTLDRTEGDEFILQNSQLYYGTSTVETPVIRVKMSNPFWLEEDSFFYHYRLNGRPIANFDGKYHEIVCDRNMIPEKWYLYPEGYSLKLVPKEIASHSWNGERHLWTRALPQRLSNGVYKYWKFFKSVLFTSDISYSMGLYFWANKNFSFNFNPLLFKFFLEYQYFVKNSVSLGCTRDAFPNNGKRFF